VKSSSTSKIFDEDVDAVQLRRMIGMVFQKPNPFPKSIYDNIVWGARMNGFRGSNDDLVEETLRKAALWDEVKDDLKKSALSLSGGQQQRLCIARALATAPRSLFDEPFHPGPDRHTEDRNLCASCRSSTRLSL